MISLKRRYFGFQAWVPCMLLSQDAKLPQKGSRKDRMKQNPAEVISVWGREGSGMISIFLAAKHRGKQEVISSFLLQV